MATNLTHLTSLQKPDVNDEADRDTFGTTVNTTIDGFDSEFATKTIDQDFNDKVLTAPEIKDYSETVYSAGNISGAVTLDYTNGNWQYATMTGDVTSLTISNLPASGKGGSMTIELIQDATGSRTLTLGSAYKSRNGVTQVIGTSANAKNLLFLLTRDAGTNIYYSIERDIS